MDHRNIFHNQPKKVHMKICSPISAIAWALIAFAALNTSTQAALLFSDDFESPTPPVAATFWLDTSKDADPVGPVGQNWIVQETDPYKAQVGQFNQAFTGFPGNGNGGPSWGPSGTGGAQYLETYASPNIVNRSWAPLSLANQAVMAANGSMSLSVEVFGLSGYDGWHSNLRIAGYDSVALAGTNPAFDVTLQETGSFLDGPVLYVGAGGTTNVVPGLVHKVNQWQTLSINADFDTDTFSLTVDGVTVPGLTWAGGDLSKIQSIALEVNSTTFQNTGFHRGGFDNFSVVSLPEPSVT